MKFTGTRLEGLECQTFGTQNIISREVLTDYVYVSKAAVIQRLYAPLPCHRRIKASKNQVLTLNVIPIDDFSTWRVLLLVSWCVFSRPCSHTGWNIQIQRHLKGYVVTSDDVGAFEVFTSVDKTHSYISLVEVY
jgi:hypothetical protein